MISLDNFDWGPTSERFKKQCKAEVFVNNDYEKIFEVELNDIVLDIGSSVGEFTYSILHKSPKHCYVIEPLEIFFNILKKNLYGYPVSFTNAAITSEKFCKILWDEHTQNVNTLTFKEYRNFNHLEKVDFFKIDCEGGEYDIFTLENLEFLISTPKIVCEFHLNSGILKEKFRIFRDQILPSFKKYDVFSLDEVDIKWDLQNEHFIEYYREVYFHIDNRK